MGTTALEDKKAVGMNEAKTRDLQAKISILAQVEKVRGSCSTIMHHGNAWPRMFVLARKLSKLYRKREGLWKLR